MGVIPAFGDAGFAPGVLDVPWGRAGAVVEGYLGGPDVRPGAGGCAFTPAGAGTGALRPAGRAGPVGGVADGLAAGGAVAGAEADAGRTIVWGLGAGRAAETPEAATGDAAGLATAFLGVAPSAGLFAAGAVEPRNRPATSSSTVLRFVFASTPISRRRARTSGTLRFISFASCPTRILAMGYSSVRRSDSPATESGPGARDSSRWSEEGPA